MAEPKEVDRLLDQMLKGKTPEEILGKEGVLKGLNKRLVERALEGEMTTHLGCEKHVARAAARATRATARRGRTS